MADSVRWTIKVSRDTDLSLRAFLGALGMKKGDLSKFVEDAVRWRMLDRTIQAWKERNPSVTDEQLMAAFEQAVRDVQGISVGHEA